MKKRARSYFILLLCSFLLLMLLPQAILRLVYPRKYATFVTQYSEQFDVPEEIVYAVIKTESNFDPNAISSAGAVGLMQIMPSTFEWLTDVKGESVSSSLLNDPETNIRYGVFFLRYLYEHYGNYPTALAAYNAGMGNVAKWLTSDEYSTNGNLTHIPFPETSEYVRLVTRRAEQYKKLYN